MNDFESNGSLVGNKRRVAYIKDDVNVCMESISGASFSCKYCFPDTVRLLSVYHDKFLALLSTGYIYSFGEGSTTILLVLPEEVNKLNIIAMAHTLEFVVIASPEKLYIFNFTNKKTQIVQFESYQIVDVQTIANSFIGLLSNGYIITNKDAIDGATPIELYHHLLIYSFGQRVYGIAAFHELVVLFLESSTILFLTQTYNHVFSTSKHHILLDHVHPTHFAHTKYNLFLNYQFENEFFKYHIQKNVFLKTSIESEHIKNLKFMPLVTAFNPLQPFLTQDSINVLDEKIVNVIKLQKSDAILPPGMQLSRNGRSYTYLSEYEGYSILWRDGRIRRTHHSQLPTFKFDREIKDLPS